MSVVTDDVKCVIEEEMVSNNETTAVQLGAYHVHQYSYEVQKTTGLDFSKKWLLTVN